MRPLLSPQWPCCYLTLWHLILMFFYFVQSVKTCLHIRTALHAALHAHTCVCKECFPHP